jgi:hypothetical protein
MGTPKDLSNDFIRKVMRMEGIIIPEKHMYPFFTECVHIIWSRKLARPTGEVFLELPKFEDAEVLFRNKTFNGERSVPLGGNVKAHMTISSQSELLKAMFPNMKRVDNAKVAIAVGVVFVTR